MNLVEFRHVVSILDGYAPRSTVNKALASAGLDRRMLDGVSGFFPYSAEAVLLESVARAVGDRHIGARVGRDFDYSAYGAYSAYVLGAPDLATALDRGRRALFLTHPGSEIVLRETDEHLVVGRDSRGLSVIGHRHLDEGALFVIGHVARHFLGSEWKPDWFEIPDASPGDIAELEAISGIEVRTAAQAPGVAIRLNDLSTVNPSPPRHDGALALNELARLMQVPPRQSMEEAVAQALNIISASLVSDEASVARLLAIGPRTLQRALKDEGTTFRDIRSRVVTARARSMLSETDIPTAEISRLLGYADARSFRRAFKARTGQSPVEFRGGPEAETASVSPDNPVRSGGE